MEEASPLLGRGGQGLGRRKVASLVFLACAVTAVVLLGTLAPR